MKGAQRPCNFHDKGQVRLKRLLVFFIHLLHLHLFINSIHQHCESLCVKELNFFCSSLRRKFPPLSTFLGSLPNGRLPKLLHSLYSAVPAEGDSRHIFIPSCGSLRSRFPPLLLFRVPCRMADSPTLFIYCIQRFLPKEIPATYSILFCGSLRSRFPPLLHSPRPEGQTNICLTGAARSAKRIGVKIA